MKVERYEERLNEVRKEMALCTKYSPEWEALEKKRMKIWIKISDLKEQEKRQERFRQEQAATQRHQRNLEIFRKMDALEKYSPEWFEAGQRLLA